MAIGDGMHYCPNCGNYYYGSHACSTFPNPNIPWGYSKIPSSIQSGWLCPKCDIGVAPFMAYCPKCFTKEKD
jgi:hypothetical protein